MLARSYILVRNLQFINKKLNVNLKKNSFLYNWKCLEPEGFKNFIWYFQYFFIEIMLMSLMPDKWNKNVYLSIGKIVVYAPTGLSRFQNPDFFCIHPGVITRLYVSEVRIVPILVWKIIWSLSFQMNSRFEITRIFFRTLIDEYVFHWSSIKHILCIGWTHFRLIMEVEQALGTYRTVDLIRDQIITIWLNVTFNVAVRQFREIPYAEQTVGKLRFVKTKPTAKPLPVN